MTGVSAGRPQTAEDLRVLCISAVNVTTKKSWRSWRLGGFVPYALLVAHYAHASRATRRPPVSLFVPLSVSHPCIDKPFLSPFYSAIIKLAVRLHAPLASM